MSRRALLWLLLTGFVVILLALGTPYDDEGREAEAPTSLHHLRHAVDVDDAIAELEVIGVDR